MQAQTVRQRNSAPDINDISSDVYYGTSSYVKKYGVEGRHRWCHEVIP